MIRRLALLLLVVITACQGGERRASPPSPAATKTVVPPATPKPLEGSTPQAPRKPPIHRDLAELIAAKRLSVLFTFNSTGYLIYRGETMGYEYELLSRYAAEKGLQLVPEIVRDSKTLFTRLNAGDGDIVAAQLVTSPDENGVSLTDGLYATSPVVVQRKQGSPAQGQVAAVATALEREQHDARDTVLVHARLISSPAELAGQRVHLSKTSPYRRQLLELNDELGEVIDVVEVDESTDHLIERLAGGKIGFTVAPENVAALNATEYTNLIVRPAIGPPQQVVWAVRRDSPRLRDDLNRWIALQKKSGLLGVLYQKYFKDRRGFARRATSDYLTAETGRLSLYDDWFREYAKIPGWDWRLMAAQAYQESRFDPNVRSWAGAVGLMQIMPRTAKELGANPGDPRQAVEAAAKYLWKLDDQLRQSVAGDRERLKFVLGAYNVGLGHVTDAQRLAQKYGDDPASWDDVAYWLIRKSKRAVYNDPVVKYGFARGTEPVAYVAQILERFQHYRAFVKREPEAPVVGNADAMSRGHALRRRTKLER